MNNPYHEMDSEELELELLHRLGWTHIERDDTWFDDGEHGYYEEAVRVGCPPTGETYSIPVPCYLDRLELVLNLPMPGEYAHWMLMYDPKDNGARAWIEWDGPTRHLGLPDNFIEPEVSQWGLARACIEAWLILDDAIREWKEGTDG